MCGIVGLLDTGRGIGPDRLREVVTAMRDTLVHRGPDDAGVWVDPTGVCALGHRRLSIIDLSAQGHQPMVDATGRVGIAYNGEIYNFQTLRRELRTQGLTFRSQSDTEVLLALLIDQQAMHLSALRGMFALAVWNTDRRELFLARDPFGKKPLYIATGSGFVAFASELRALDLLEDVDRSIEADALGEYLLLQYVHAPRTIYRGVRKLPPGTCAHVDAGGAIRESSYWQFRAGSVTPGITLARSFEGRVDQFGARVTAAVERRLVSDVPLGAFLSGGVDSALVAAVMRHLGAETKTYSVGFADTPDSEHHQARRVAEHLGTDHHELLLHPDAVDLAPVIAAALDEPNGDSSCLPTYLLSEFTRRHVTVALSGDGGDEMFGGYGRYLDTLDESVQTPVPDGWSASEAYLGVRWTIFQRAIIKDMMGEVPAAVDSLLERWTRMLEQESRPLIHRMRNVDAESYLPGAVLAKVDRMSMQFSLEVRCPLLDVEVAEFAAALRAEDCVDRGPDGRHRGKVILKALLQRWLPPEWVQRPKTGFGLPPHFWDAASLLSLADEVLNGRSTQLHGSLSRRGLRRWLATQHDPGQFSIYRLWPLLILELWLSRSAPRRMRL